VPGYDVDGKLWTVQYIKEDGTKRFAKDSRKHGGAKANSPSHYGELTINLLARGAEIIVYPLPA
jgi:phage/plasmid primase-like uncharacterized protein